MKLRNQLFFVLWFVAASFRSISQETKSMDATKIAGDYYNSIVKILLLDSVAEKKVKGSGYLGRGSGFIVTEDGYIFTNRHVVDYCLDFMRYTYYNPSNKKIEESSDTYNPKALTDPSYTSVNYVSKASPIVQVYTDKFGNYKLYYARIIAIDTVNFDGAIIKIVSEINGATVTDKFHPVPIGNSDSTNQGEDLCVYGFPAQYDAGLDIMLRDQSTLTFGKHSGFDYVFNSIYGVIKTDASINSGNSGGPVFNQSNKVIGIATAASEKTNTGLIGGINPMYNLAALDPSLLKVLTGKGLVAPGKKVEIQTASLAANHFLPSPKELKKINILKKNVRDFKGGTWYFKGFLPMQNEYKYAINASSDQRFITNSSNPLNVKIKAGFGFEVGHLFTLWRITPTQKLSLDWTLFNLTSTTEYWGDSHYYHDTAGTFIRYNAKTSQTRISTRLGLNYSQLIFKHCILDIYYKASLFTTNSSGNWDQAVAVFDSRIGDYNYVLNYRSDKHPGFLTSFGFNFRYKLFTLGLEYSFGSVIVEYAILYNKPQTNPYGNTKIDGLQKIKTLSLTGGIALQSKNKWKRILRRANKASS